MLLYIEGLPSVLQLDILVFPYLSIPHLPFFFHFYAVFFPFPFLLFFSFIVIYMKFPEGTPLFLPLPF